MSRIVDEPYFTYSAYDALTSGIQVKCPKCHGTGVVTADEDTLTHFWATGEPCLWITDPEQIGMPKMEFMGGHPDEYCIFLKNLTETELAQITSLDGAPLDVKEELSDIE